MFRSHSTTPTSVVGETAGDELARFRDVDAREVVEHGANAHCTVHEPHVPLAVLHAHLLEAAVSQLQRSDAFQAAFSVRDMSVVCCVKKVKCSVAVWFT